MKTKEQTQCELERAKYTLALVSPDDKKEIIGIIKSLEWVLEDSDER